MHLSPIGIQLFAQNLATATIVNVTVGGSNSIMRNTAGVIIDATNVRQQLIGPPPFTQVCLCVICGFLIDRHLIRAALTIHLQDSVRRLCRFSFVSFRISHGRSTFRFQRGRAGTNL